jgi:hypothetical protein
MKPLQITLTATGIALVIFTAAFINKSASSRTTIQPTNSGNGFAVVELFTSEGCSSCPPADAVLARIQQEAGNKPVYILAYHVDYWNRLGWKDQFSNPQYSKRQYQYSRQFTGQVYTPQVIINGGSECVGSDESAINSIIADALNTPVCVSIKLQGRINAGGIDLDYQLTGNTGNGQLLIALVQKHAVSNVKAGENEGRTLSHAEIVRQLYARDLPAANQGTEHVHLPTGFNTKDWEIIGIIQNTNTGVITAATRALLNAGPSAL